MLIPKTIYENYKNLAIAIIHNGVMQYKKAIREGYDLSATRKYLNNPHYETLVKLVLDCTVDEMLNTIEKNYAYSKEKKYDRGIFVGGK